MCGGPLGEGSTASTGGSISSGGESNAGRGMKPKLVRQLSTAAVVIISIVSSAEDISRLAWGCCSITSVGDPGKERR